MTSEEIGSRIDALERMLAEKVRQGARLEAVIMILLERVGDTSRVTVKEAAAIEERLFGHGSVHSVRRKIDAGKYRFEKRPGEKQGRIPIEDIYEDYMPINLWRASLAQQKGR